MRLFRVIIRTLVGGGSYPSAEIQPVYSTVPAHGVNFFLNSQQLNVHLALTGNVARH